jgi:hypothetical protein
VCENAISCSLSDLCNHKLNLPVHGDASNDPGNGAEEMVENDDEELNDW